MGIAKTFVFSNNPVIRIGRHVVFWLWDIAYYLLILSANREVDITDFYRMVLILPLIIVPTYFILYYIIPSSLKDGYPLKMIGWAIFVILFISITLRLYRVLFIFPLFDMDVASQGNLWDLRRALGDSFGWLPIMGLAVVIKLLKKRTELVQHNEQLNFEKRQAELNYLKAQMQPHFLFNTLNTLYSETIKDSAKAGQIVLHLSSLMRFILNECSKPVIPLTSEIKVLEDFIALERLRHGARLNVNFNIGTVDPKATIAPLVFLPFVENSFKHTLANQTDTIHIDIDITMRDRFVNLSVKNDDIPGRRNQINGVKPGSGIHNTKRQLDLLYGNSYSLSINDKGNENKYSVLLTVPVKV